MVAALRQRRPASGSGGPGLGFLVLVLSVLVLLAVVSGTSNLQQDTSMPVRAAPAAVLSKGTVQAAAEPHTRPASGSEGDKNISSSSSIRVPTSGSAGSGGPPTAHSIDAAPSSTAANPGPSGSGSSGSPSNSSGDGDGGSSGSPGSSSGDGDGGSRHAPGPSADATADANHTDSGSTGEPGGSTENTSQSSAFATAPPPTADAAQVDGEIAGGEGASEGDGGGGGSEAACSKALGIKKVALLFLTTRRLAHEKLWRLWMWDAAGLMPQQALQQYLQAVPCDSTTATAAASPSTTASTGGAAAGEGEGVAAEAQSSWVAVREACARVLQEPHLASTAGGQAQLPPQLLYSIYVHAPPDYGGLEFQPLFQGRLLSKRVTTGWGLATITDAERLLLQAALRDPLNHKFVLLSDHDIPLHDPLTFYQQLMHEDRSRSRACPIAESAMSIDRWNGAMATDRFKRKHWRKSSQFFSLTRPHAEEVVRDNEVYRSFKERCDRMCIPDEHYIPTLLAVLGRENETYCDSGGLAYTDWTGGGMHPRSFEPKDVTAALIRKIRDTCTNHTSATEDAKRMFVPVARLLNASSAEEACSLLQQPAHSGDGDGGSDTSSNGGSSGGGGVYMHPLPSACPLTARKFPAYTALRIRQLFLSSCPEGTGQVRSKAALTLDFKRDPGLALFRGQACTTGVEKVLAGGSVDSESDSTRRLSRQLLCTLWSASPAWLRSGGDSLAPRYHDTLDAYCDTG